MSGEFQAASVAATSLANLRFENAGTARLDGGVTTFGQVFAQGEVPRGNGLVATISGAAVPVQMDVKTTWPDGSVKMAVLAVERPDLAAGAGVDVALSRAPASAGQPVDLAAASLGHSFLVDLAIQGRAPIKIDVLDALRDALADGTASLWQKGALATEARVEILIPNSSQRLLFDVTAWKGGGITVEASFNNDRAMEAVGGRAQYSVTATLDGAQVLNRSVNQAQYQNWRETFATEDSHGGQNLGGPSTGWLNIRHDVAELGRLGVVADFDLSLKIPETSLSGFLTATQSPGWGEPFANNGVVTYMPNVGGRPDIGMTTGANASWLISGDARAAAYALGQAEAASGVTWQFWDEANGTWLNTANYPRIWVDGRGGTGRPGDPTSTGLTQQRESFEATGWFPERAHQPDLSFVPYVLTGERWMLDNLNAQSAWNLTELWPAPRGDGAGILSNTEMVQTRSAAWAMRQIENAFWAAPDGSAEQAYFNAISDANWKWIASQLPKWTAEQGEAHGYLPTMGGNHQLVPWQQDYFASTAIAAASRGNTDALTYLNWAKNFLIGRFEAADEGFNIRDGAAFVVVIRPSTDAPYFKTWAEIGAATVAAGQSNGTGWNASQGDYARLAMSTLAGLYHLTGDERARDAYTELAALNPPYTGAADFARMAQTAVTIPGIYGGLITEPPTTPEPPTRPQPNPGNDTVILTSPVLDQVIDLGGGSDQLTLSSAGPNRVTVSNVEVVRGGSANDVVTMANVPAGATVDLGAGQDTLILNNGTFGLIVSNTEIIRGSAERDVVVMQTVPDGASIDLAGGNDLLIFMDAASKVRVANVEAVQGSGLADDVIITTATRGMTVDLGGGADRLELSSAGPNRLTVHNVETILGGAAADEVTLGTAVQDIVVNLGGGADKLVLSSAGPNRLTVHNVETILGGAAADTVSIGTRLVNGVIDLGDGYDKLVLLEASNSVTVRNVEQVRGTLGNDTISMDGSVAVRVQGAAGDDMVTGSAGDDTLNGGGGNDTLSGGSGQDILDGGAGNDRLSGGAGWDILVGGIGRDTMEGGADADWFVFRHASHSPIGAPDLILDFTPGTDLLVFEGLLSGRFEWRGTDGFTANGSTQARAAAPGKSTMLLLDFDGNGSADAGIELAGISPASLSAASFVWL